MAPAPLAGQTVTIVGTGLLGASLGLALRARTDVKTVLGVSRSPEGLRTAVERGAVDTGAASFADAAAQSDCVVFATPVGTMGQLMGEAASVMRPDAVVTDVGSTKASVVRDVCAAWPAGTTRFIGAHPMAGAELKGAAHARADLFDGAVVVLTPQPSADPDALTQVRSLWEAVGGRVHVMTPEQHDAVVARTSHLPHLMATVLTQLVAELDGEKQAILGQGFLDTTRVAAGDPEVWRDICLTNADALLHLWPELLSDLGELRALIDAADGAGLLAHFARLRDVRTGLGPTGERDAE